MLINELVYRNHTWRRSCVPNETFLCTASEKRSVRGLTKEKPYIEVGTTEFERSRRNVSRDSQGTEISADRREKRESASRKRAERS